MNALQYLADKAGNDEYLSLLLYELEVDYSHYIVNDLNHIKLITSLKLGHLLRFADILCRSMNSEHRNLSLKIISLLLEFQDYKKDDYVKLICINTLVKLGNFPSLECIPNKDAFFDIDEIGVDYDIKCAMQESPLGDPFTDGQYSIFEDLKSHNHFSFSGSTSFGKSFVLEAFTKYLVDTYNDNINIAFVVPTKALIHQLSNRLKKIIDNSQYKIISTPQIPKILLKKEYKYIFIFTPERLISYLTNPLNSTIDYIFVDEAHKLLSSKDLRTPILYHALVLAKRKSINIYFASPNVPNADVFLQMINNSSSEARCVNESTVTQNRFFIDTIKDKSYMLSDYGNDIFLGKFNFGSDKNENLKIILDTISSDSQSIIYCNTIYQTIYTALHVSKLYADIKNEQINELVSLIDEKIHEAYYLKTCLKKGIAYHFGSIPEEIKNKVEELYSKGIIRFLFCTSTLLEGVNFPVKNIFILSEKIGNRNMEKIDFWNLAGRAGRLKKELSGNIFCVNLYNKDGYWNNEKKVAILRDKNIDPITPLIMTKSNQNLYKNISNYFQDFSYTRKNMSANEEKTIELYGNILVYHELISGESILKYNYINAEDNGVHHLRKLKKEIIVPSDIVASNIDINIKSQNMILKDDSNYMPENTDYEGCLRLLNILYEKYNWDKTESKGKTALVKSKEQLQYYAVLMSAWIATKPLKVILQACMNHFWHNGRPLKIELLDFDGKRKIVDFDIKNPLHINTVINNIVKDIENKIKYKIKNYVSNYMDLYSYKNQKKVPDWEAYLEYGTKDPIIIELQNWGFSRTVASLLKKEFAEFLKKDCFGELNINEAGLKKALANSRYKEEYLEVSMLYGW
ncbi:MAG: DEAD/DEAH box helicase [Clostridium sp.]|uniref:DEAD/DEAH box helicase n=1 Tax=Clostridium sp. TaxID=1506 RepID=UPI001E17B74A|nr:DEAD/DEAH box helicase [Clostridium sp.]MBS5126604.1 DEAD/DEAH box helicase [Clostridium sp.]